MDNPHKLITAGKDISPKKESKKGSDADTDTNIEGEELDSPLNMNLIDFSQEIPNDDSQTEETKTPQDLPSFKDKKIYDQSSFIYDKYSKFEHPILIKELLNNIKKDLTLKDSEIEEISNRLCAIDTAALVCLTNPLSPNAYLG